MLTLRTLLLGLLLTGLALNPVYAAAMASMTDAAGVPQTVHRENSSTVSAEHEHCQTQSAGHTAKTHFCCKTGQCDCLQATAIAMIAAPDALAYGVVPVDDLIFTGQPPLSAVRFFRPPIA